MNICILSLVIFVSYSFGFYTHYNLINIYRKGIGLQPRPFFDFNE